MIRPRRLLGRRCGIRTADLCLLGGEFLTCVILCAAALHAHAVAAQTGAQTGRTKTVTLAEGPSFVVPAEWDAQASATPPRPSHPAETIDLRVRTRDSSVAFQFEHFQTLGLRKTDLASLKASLQKGLSPGSLLDLGSPTSRGFYQRRAALVGRGYDEYFFWVDVGGKPWHFKCMELLKATPTQSAGAGGCLAVMRSFNASTNETPTAPTGTVQDNRPPVSPAATPSASTPLPSGSSSGSRPTPTATGASSSTRQTPGTASSQPHPGEAGPVRFRTMSGFAVELPAGWRLYSGQARSEDGRQLFRADAEGAFALSSIRRIEKDPRYQSFQHAQGRAFFRTFTLPPGVGQQYPSHEFLLELDGHGWRFQCTAAPDTCLTIAKSARYATPTPHTAQRDAGASPKSEGANGQPRTTGPWHPPAASSPTPPSAQPPDARPSQPNVTPPSSAPAPSNPSTAASSPIVAELSKDSRLTSLPADTRELVLSFIRDAYQQCATSEMGNVYDCGCFARLLLDARFRAGTETTGGVSEGRIGRIGRPDFKVSSTTVLFDVKNTQSSSCIVPAQVEKYASDLAYSLLPTRSDQERKSRAACAARDVRQSFLAKPKMEVRYFHSLVTTALSGACR